MGNQVYIKHSMKIQAVPTRHQVMIINSQPVNGATWDEGTRAEVEGADVLQAEEEDQVDTEGEEEDHVAPPEGDQSEEG